MIKIFLPVILSVAFLSGCESVQNAGQKETIGAVTGAVVGGVLGSKVGGGKGQLFATGAGAVLGAIAGSSVGRSLDQNDRMMMERTSQKSLESAPTGSASAWRNPDSGNSGTVTPTRTYQDANGNFCREFEQYVTINGSEQRATGTACRQEDGTWRITS